MFDQDNMNGALQSLNGIQTWISFFTFFEPFSVNGYVVMRPQRDECTIVQLSLDLEKRLVNYSKVANDKIMLQVPFFCLTALKVVLCFE